MELRAEEVVATQGTAEGVDVPRSSNGVGTELGIEDPEIFDAVRYHTTGRSNMSLLEKVIFIADFIALQ